VQNLSISTVGAVVTPAQTIATIVPGDTPLIVEAVLSNTDIGHVHTDQRVELKIDTYPFQKYGTLAGRVVWISPDAEPRMSGSPDPTEASGPNAPASVPGKSGLMYRIRIKPDHSALLTNAVTRPLAAGMTVQAEIITDRRRIIEFFLAPILKSLDEGLKVR